MLAPSREITSSIDASNILSGYHTRKARRDNDFTYAITMYSINKELPALLYTFAASLYIEKLDY